MPAYTLNISLPGQGADEQILQRLERIDGLLDRLVEEDVLPLLARNYDRSGLKSPSGQLRKAVSQRGAKGNSIVKFPGGIRIGVDLNELPYARWVIEGRGPVTAKRAKALHFKDENGKDVFVKSVGAAPPHDIFYLEEGDVERLEGELMQMVGGK